MRNARHIEVQIIGDGKEVSHLTTYTGLTQNFSKILILLTSSKMLQIH